MHTIESIDIPASSQAVGETLHLRRANGGASIPTLFLHGSSIPASVAFCTEFGGASYLELYANKGLDAWCLDFRGFGHSYRPDGADGPVVSTEDAVADVSAAVNHILLCSGSQQLDIVGWSWGATVAGAFAAQEPETLRRLGLLAPQWLRDTPSPLLKNPAVLQNGYRSLAPDSIVERWMGSMPDAVAAEVRRLSWHEILKGALADPSNSSLEAPNGPLVEIAECWSGGSPVYDPRQIEVPVRLVVGAEDPETPPHIVRRLFSTLSANADAQYLEIAGATHFAPLEPRREKIVDFFAQFLA